MIKKIQFYLWNCATDQFGTLFWRYFKLYLNILWVKTIFLRTKWGIWAYQYLIYLITPMQVLHHFQIVDRQDLSSRMFNSDFNKCLDHSVYFSFIVWQNKSSLKNCFVKWSCKEKIKYLEKEMNICHLKSPWGISCSGEETRLKKKEKTLLMK